MLIGSLNIQAAFGKKFLSIKKFVEDQSLDMIALSEVDVDTRKGDYIPHLSEFNMLKCKGMKIRLVAYIKYYINVDILDYQGELPVIVCHTPQMTIGFIYSEFTRAHARLTEAERLGELEEFFEWFGSKAKSKAVLIGDMNVNWSDNKKNHSEETEAVGD